MKNLTLVIAVAIGIVALISCNTSPKSATSEQIEEVEIVKEVETGPAWEQKFYVDDFGDATTESYITIQTEGTFSNSATEGSDLRVVLIVDDGDLRIDLYEYGEGPALTFEGGNGGVVKFKIGDEVISAKTIYDDDNGDLMFWSGGINISNASTYLNKMFAKSTVKCVVEVKPEFSNTFNKYVFDIPTRNLESLLTN